MMTLLSDTDAVRTASKVSGDLKQTELVWGKKKIGFTHRNPPFLSQEVRDPVDGQLEQRVTLKGHMRPSLLQSKHGRKGYQLGTIRAGSDRWGRVQIPSGVYLYILSRAQGSLTCDWLSASPSVT